VAASRGGDRRETVARTLRAVAGGVGMARKIVDCRDMPNEKGCTLTIAGEEDEVVRAAVMHAVDVHDHEETAELRDQVRRSLKEERATSR
jgi:predicted small metal-binding protein